MSIMIVSIIVLVLLGGGAAIAYAVKARRVRRRNAAIDLVIRQAMGKQLADEVYAPNPLFFRTKGR